MKDGLMIEKGVQQLETEETSLLAEAESSLSSSYGSYGAESPELHSFRGNPPRCWRVRILTVTILLISALLLIMRNSHEATFESVPLLGKARKQNHHRHSSTKTTILNAPTQLLWTCAYNYAAALCRKTKYDSSSYGACICPVQQLYLPPGGRYNCPTTGDENSITDKNIAKHCASWCPGHVSSFSGKTCPDIDVCASCGRKQV
jgi:hypothetical protein